MNKPIKFSGGQSSSLDDLAGGMPPQVNVFTDAAGAAWMRPGIVAWSGFPDTAPIVAPVTGIGILNGTVVYSVRTDSFRSDAYAVTPNATATKITTTITEDRLIQGAGRPIFTPTRTRLFMTAGGGSVYWEGSGFTTSMLSTIYPVILPVKVSHSVAISRRMVANDSGVSGLIYWSDVGDDSHIAAWSTGSEFTEAEVEPDPVKAIYKSAGELVAIGTRTIQMFSPDPSVTFTPARTIPWGSNAPYSFVGIDEQFLLLDTKSRIMLSNGRSYQSVSTPAIGRDLERLGTTSDCWGFRCNIDGHDIAVFNFPTAGRTFAYDLPAQQWNEWRSWRNGTWAPLAITAHCYDDDRKIHLVGLADGRIATLSMDAHTEMGEPLIAELTSAFVDHGTMSWKQSKVVRFKFRRGRAANSQSVAVVSYRDDLGPFGEPFRIPLGDSSDVSPIREIRSAGTYQQRQWRIQVDSNEFVFAGAEEDFTALQA